MDKIKFVTIFALSLLAGCSTEVVKQDAAEQAQPKLNQASPKTEESKAKLSVDKKTQPASQVAKKDSKKSALTAIDPKVLYLIMTAEIAGQRNQYDVALEGYMQAAKEVDDVRVAERAAKIALFMQENIKADEAVHLWLRQDSGNINAQTLAALTALRSGNKQASLEHLQMLLKLDPAGFENTLLDVLKSLGDTDKLGLVGSVLDELSVKNPDQAVIYFIQSLLAMQTKDYAQADAKLKRTLTLQPGWDKALIAQAQLSVLRGDLKQAESLLRDAIVKIPNELKFQRMLAQVLIKAGKFNEAMAVYQGILAKNPNDGDSLFSIALLHLQLQQDAEAKKYLESISTRPEWAGQAAFYLGKLAVKEGNTQKALVWFDSVTSGAFEAEATLSAVSLLMEQHRYSEAMNRIDRIQGKFPQQQLRILVLQAEIYNEQKQYPKAHKVLSDALKDMPGQKELLYTRSLVSERMGNLPAMEKDLLEILKKYPDDSAALNALGYTLANKTKRFAESEKYLKRALGLQPDAAVILDSYGWLNFKRGNLKVAKDYLERAYAKQAEPEIGGHLVEVLWKLDLKEDARELFDKVFNSAPNDEYLLELKQKFFRN